MTDGPRAGEPMTRLPGYIPAVSGATAGLVAGVVVCPLDVVKTRLQVQGIFRSTGAQAAGSGAGARAAVGTGALGPATAAAGSVGATGVVGTLRQIVTEEGVRSLYSGLTPLLIGYLPSWAIYFYVYKRMQDKLLPRRGAAAGTAPGYLPEVACAVTAGACSTVATNPIWMIKTRMMAQSRHTAWRYNGFIDAARSIYRQEGIRAFYSGLSSALLGLPHVAIHFPLYEKLKNRWAPHHEWGGILAASIVSKVIASTITYPHEVVRSRNQIKSAGTKYRGVLRTVRTLWVEEGWRVFYAGLTANMCRAAPASAVTLLTFELVSSSLARNFLARNDSTVHMTSADSPPNVAIELGSPVVEVVIQHDNDE